MIEFLIGFGLGRYLDFKENNLQSENLVQKWKYLLNYSSSLGCPKIPTSDHLLVSSLFEKAEKYAFKKNLPSSKIFNLLLEIRKNYKTTTYAFN